MLAATTEVSRLTSCRQLGEAMSAARALFLRLAVDGHEAPILFVRLVARLRLDRLDGRAEHLSSCRVEAGGGRPLFAQSGGGWGKGRPVGERRPGSGAPHRA